jgi:sulfur relay (sulfurtransferase) DsrF/TusC family protein
MAKYLSVIDGAYRASLEEQDDAGLWFTGAVVNSGLECDVILTGNAVNYAITTHSNSAMTMGGGVIPHPMNPMVDIERMKEKGVSLFMVKEDAEERGIRPDELMGGVEAISRDKLTHLIEQYDGIWHW